MRLKKEEWALVYEKRDFDFANKLIDMMTSASKAFGISIEEP